jgi:hypothetical protein
VQQILCLFGLEAAQVQLGKPARRKRGEFGLPRGEQHRHRFVLHPSPCKGESLGRTLVQPMRVVDNAEQGLLGGGRREQAKGGRVGGEPVDPFGLDERQRRLQGRRLRLGQLVEKPEDRPHELLQRGEWELSLRLNTERAQHSKVRRFHDRLFEQRCLADPRLAADDEGAASTLAGPLEQTLDLRAFLLPSHEHVQTVSGRGSRHNATVSLIRGRSPSTGPGICPKRTDARRVENP